MLRPAIVHLLQLVEEIIFPEFCVVFSKTIGYRKVERPLVFRHHCPFASKLTCQFHSHYYFNIGYAIVVLSSFRKEPLSIPFQIVHLMRAIG